jgi:dTDP-4-amino-4,6-dideoxygalactose transaminase
MIIPFNMQILSGEEARYVSDAIVNSASSAGPVYKKRCEKLIEKTWGYKDIRLTTSCTAALEICAILINISEGDEVIVPSWTFPSTASAFIRQGARIVLADSRKTHPGIDEEIIESLITPKTKAIVPVHYAGISCDMERIMRIAEKHGIFVIEDAAHGIGAYYNDRALGSIGHLGCLSFHGTKNIQCEEGGALIINDSRFQDRAWHIIEKGTNRHEFINGITDHYEWSDLGSSYAMSELHAAYLLAQIENLPGNDSRKEIWDEYFHLLEPLRNQGSIDLPRVPGYSMHNAHIFYIILQNREQRDNLKDFLSSRHIGTVAHYTPLHASSYWNKINSGLTSCGDSARFGDCLLRLPLYNSMTTGEARYVVSSIMDYFK